MFFTYLHRLQNKSSRPHTTLCRHSHVVYQLFRQLFRPACAHRCRQHHRGQGKSIVISNLFPYPSRLIFRSLFLNLQPTIGQWRIVFIIAAAIYAICASFYVIFGSGERQKWDNPALDDEKQHTPKAVDNENGLTKRNVKETKY